MTEIKVHIRWMVRNDLPDVLNIEHFNRESWLEKDFITYLRERNHIAMVAEYKNKVVGFMVYELDSTVIHIEKLAVHPEFRRKGVGSQIIAKLLAKLGGKRKAIDLVVHERNVNLQLFLKSNGFKAVDIIHGYFDKEDGYLMNFCEGKSNEQNSVLLLRRGS